MQEVNPKNIDLYHEEIKGTISKAKLQEIYKEILSHPLRYFFANNYVKKFIYYTLCPFVIILLVFNNVISELNLNKFVELIVVLLMVWVWFNKSTCYVFMKLLMIFNAALPFTNSYYNATGQVIRYKFVKFLLCTVFVLISIQISYQVISS